MNLLRTWLLLALAWGLAVPALGNTSGTGGLPAPEGASSTVAVQEEKAQSQAQRRGRAFTLDAAIQASPFSWHVRPSLNDVFNQYMNADRYRHRSHEDLSYASIPITLGNTGSFSRWEAEVYDYSGYLYFKKGLNTSLDINADADLLNSSDGIYRYYNYDPVGGLTFASFGTNPTVPYRIYGKGVYEGQFFGLMTEKSGTVEIMNEAYAALNLEIDWGRSFDWNGHLFRYPGLSGFIGDVYYSPVDFKDAQLDMHKSKEGFKRLRNLMYFNYSNWFAPIGGYYLTRLSCAFWCVIEEGGGSKVQGMFVGTGSGYLDPEIFSGSFHLINYRIDGVLMDWIGFMDARTPSYYNPIARGHGTELYSPSQALSVRVVGEKYRAQGSAFGNLSLTEMVSVVQAAGTMVAQSSVYATDSAVPTHFDFSSGLPTLRWVDFNLQDQSQTGEYRSVVGGHAAAPLSSGRATYHGYSTGAYSALITVGNTLTTTVADTYVARSRLVIDLDPTSPSLYGHVGYGIEVDALEPVTGRLALSGGQWNPNSASFSDGTISCSGFCQVLGTINTWSAQYINIAAPTTSSIAQQPDGMIGQFGAMSISHYNPFDDIEVLFHTHGLFAMQNSTVTTSSDRPPHETYYAASPAAMIVGDSGRFNRQRLADGFTKGSWNRVSMYDNLSPRVNRAPNGNFVHPGNTMYLSTPLWFWRTGDYGNCYCTMFLSVAVFDTDGITRPSWLASKSSGSTYEFDGRYGYAFGMWKQDIHPAQWHAEGIGNKLGIYVDGTHPNTLPTTSMAEYTGDVAFHAIPSSSTDASDMKNINGQVVFNVQWTIGAPTFTGHLALGGHYTGTVNTDLEVALGGATWSSQDKRFTDGTLTCIVGCVSTLATGSWEAVFVEMRDDKTEPEIIAGAFALSSLDLIGASKTWDLFGWFTGGTDYFHSPERAWLNTPVEVIDLAEKEGFTAIYKNATTAQRFAAVIVAGRATLGNDQFMYGHVDTNGGINLRNTGFWADHNAPSFIGVKNTGYTVSQDHMPLSGNASYTGDIAGVYASAAGESGMTHGKLSLSMQFSANNKVVATGEASLNFSDSAVNLSMNSEFTGNHVIDGVLSCATGCVSQTGIGRWGGRFIYTDSAIVPGEAPNAITGTWGISGLSSNNDTYDALGIFTGVKE